MMAKVQLQTLVTAKQINNLDPKTNKWRQAVYLSLAMPLRFTFKACPHDLVLHRINKSNTLLEE